ncbi:MAG: hypothetical protein D3904_08005 [Candidatus Electrothrix sp. EH2]|nr:hypothetical protein [Candidatus Electrothrix sp. EH2]
MKKVVIISAVIALQALSGNASARTEYCSGELSNYKNAIKMKIQTYKDRGTNPPPSLEKAQKYFLNDATSEVKLRFIKSGKDGWATIGVKKVERHNDFRRDCISSVLNKVCPQGWQDVSHGNMYQEVNVQCKGW